MRNQDFILGIDTSNYKTSLALSDLKGDILFDSRKSLMVKQGERGLRQSHALFQHVDNLPELAEELFRQFDRNRIAAVAASDKPRPVEGSYMPVFKAGVNFGKVIAASLGLPFFTFSHQEGHIEAVKHNSCITQDDEFLTYHLSGGTCELLQVKGNGINIIGGSKDISFGQVIDRVGVALGMAFPAGEEMDKLALNGSIKEKNLKRIPLDRLFINLSGLETQCHRELEKGASAEMIVPELFQKISVCLCELTEKAFQATDCSKILFAGGVSSSDFIKKEINRYFKGKPVSVIFGEPKLSSDNAVGISFLGGKAYGNQTN